MKLAAMLLAILAGVFAARAINSFTLPMSGVVPTTGTVTMKVDGNAYTSGTNIEWGSTPPGVYTKSIEVTNTMNVASPLTFAVAGLPTGFTLTCNLPTSVPAFGSVSGTLTLTIPSNAVAGPWTCTVTI